MNGLMNIPQLEFLLAEVEPQPHKSLLLCYCILQAADPPFPLPACSHSNPNFRAAPSVPRHFRAAPSVPQ